MQAKNVLSSEAICGDYITLKPFSAKPEKSRFVSVAKGVTFSPPELVPPLFRPKLRPCVQMLLEAEYNTYGDLRASPRVQQYQQ